MTWTVPQKTSYIKQINKTNPKFLISNSFKTRVRNTAGDFSFIFFACRYISYVLSLGSIFEKIEMLTCPHLLLFTDDNMIVMI